MVNKIQPNFPLSYASNVNRIDSSPKMPQNITPYTDKRPAEINLSEDARILQRATRSAQDAPEIRQDVVQTIQSQLDIGIYQVQPDDLAERLLSVLI
jgi:anti-sigma28 factor (negative regulator of flagellin synthesis)